MSNRGTLTPSSPRQMRAVAVWAVIAMILGSCTARPSEVAQQRTCLRPPDDLCTAAIAAVVAEVPAAKASARAIVDYADLTPPAVTLGSESTTLLVAFEPWAGVVATGAYRSPPLWRVTKRLDRWSIEAVDVTEVNVCFIEVLGGAGLTDYAPPHPDICGSPAAPAST